MPSQVLSTVENNFTKGLVTEFTGLNFPENAATDTDNCNYTLIGDVTRRLGFDYETNYQRNLVDRDGYAVSQHVWKNVSGDGVTQVVVTQIGHNLYFYPSSGADVTHPLSSFGASTNVISIDDFATSAAFDGTTECQFSDGNGYLFVFHPNCNPFYCTYNAGHITAAGITVKIRDFAGIPETGEIRDRPNALSAIHQYNLFNQGWGRGSTWGTAASATSVTPSVGAHTFVIPAGLTITVGDLVSINTGADVSGAGYYFTAPYNVMSGNVTAYAGNNLTVNVTSVNASFVAGRFGLPITNANWLITPLSTQYVDLWHTALTTYPSNADQWWRYKNASNVFDPTTTINQVTYNQGAAPKGSLTLPAFSITRSAATSIAGLTDIITTTRPRTGLWHKGRVWYAGADASQQATGNAPYYTWTENIYFSQVIVNTLDFGSCFQANDPTSETLFDLLPTDGGVITIQGSGPVYKLVPYRNGLLVFAANGIWYITGSQGLGFVANDYSVMQLSKVRALSPTSFVDVLGVPYFWNEDGIYTIEETQTGTDVNPILVVSITYTTIQSFYNDIPLEAKMYARGVYDPINYTIQWIYRNRTDVNPTPTTITNRYCFDRVLNFNTANKAFFPYSISIGNSSLNPYISGITYVQGTTGLTGVPSSVKYLMTTLGVGAGFTFGGETNGTYVDWASTQAYTSNYSSYLITGYKLHGQGQRRFQIPYIYVFSRLDDDISYKIQSQWDYATSGNSGRWSAQQVVTEAAGNFGMKVNRLKLRGQGLVLQIKISSEAGKAFDIMGWSSFETQNTGV